jgi:general secretion pathway protein G
MASRSLKKGFTLVEILIVVVILGILAAIVIPQFTSASETAKASSLVSQLQTIRSQLELYQVQHNGDYPDLSANWDQLTEKTELDGTVAADDFTGTTYGPYLQKAPNNPFEDSTSTADAPAAGVGWVYDSTTGEIEAVIELTKAREVGLIADDEDGSDSDDIETHGS